MSQFYNNVSSEGTEIKKKKTSENLCIKEKVFGVCNI